MRELAVRQGVDNSYVSRIINLPILPTCMVAEILDDTLPNYMTLLELAADPPLVWDEQRERAGPSVLKINQRLQATTDHRLACELKTPCWH